MSNYQDTTGKHSTIAGITAFAMIALFSQAEGKDKAIVGITAFAIIVLYGKVKKSQD